MPIIFLGSAALATIQYEMIWYKNILRVPKTCLLANLSYHTEARKQTKINERTNKQKNGVARNKVKCPWSQSWWRKKVYSEKDLWNRQVLATSERVMGDDSAESTEVDNVTGTARGKS